MEEYPEDNGKGKERKRQESKAKRGNVLTTACTQLHAIWQAFHFARLGLHSITAGH